MTINEILETAALYSEQDGGSLVSFYPSNLLKFAHAIEAARATAEQSRDNMIYQEWIGSAWVDVEQEQYEGARIDRRRIVCAVRHADAPIDMVLYCPNCGTQHIDAVEEHETDRGLSTDLTVTWTNPPHRSHLCHACETIWRPADVATNGVAATKTEGKADTWPNGLPDDALATHAQSDVADAMRYRWLSKRVVITDGSTPGLMVITAVDDGIEYGNEFLDEFTEPALAAIESQRSGDRS